jgi:hypothetical protein
MDNLVSVEERLSRMERIVHRSRVLAAVATALGVVAVVIAHGRQPRYDNIVIDEDSIGIRSKEGWIHLSAHALSMSDKYYGTVISSGRIQMADNLKEHTHNVEIKPSSFAMTYSPKGYVDVHGSPSAFYELGVDKGQVHVDIAGHDTAWVGVDDGKHQTRLLPGESVNVRPSDRGDYLEKPDAK